jgi:hypothetical protein
MFKRSKNLIKSVMEEGWAKSCSPNDEFWTKLTEWIYAVLLPEFMTKYIGHIDEIIHIDPNLTERQILEMVAMHMVKSVDASYGSVRIYDPDTEQMLSFGSYPPGEEARESNIAQEGSIAGEVVKSGNPFLVPNIHEEGRYHDKTIIERKGINSMMAIPFEIPRFFPHERATAGQ